MAAPFVSVAFTADWTGACRSRTMRGSPINAASSLNNETSPSESVSWMRGVGPWGAAVGTPVSDGSWIRPSGGVLDGSYTLLEGEVGNGDNLMERLDTPMLLGYEILEERAKFTVYKILVKGHLGDSRVIFRRYADFCRLNDKLKELFPSFALALPPKRWFKNNYDEKFLEKRRTGLQTFLQNLTSRKDIINSKAVKHFLCLRESPNLFDSLEESRAFCETLEETYHRLQRQLLENQREADTLKKTLEEKENHISLLLKRVK
uniref:sorting nexin-16-like n=1 Tax=Scatophagus argus TaxID=75038 RepID=UPI001ED7FC8D|nr:sorting nexin-16-like [Scatophagus argus]XP_046264375.1 sorting nexin-16-like [Scatophagus argus]